jgi:hypothetical protein
VAKDPQLVERLPRAALQALGLRALTVHQTCALALLAGSEVEEVAPLRPELLTADAVARLMGGLSRREIYRQARHFPFSTFVVRPTPGTLRFRRALVEEYLRDPDAYRVRHAGAAASGPVTHVRRMGRGGA